MSLERKLIRFLITATLIAGPFTQRAQAAPQNSSVSSFLQDVVKKKQGALNSRSPKEAPIKIHFFWASWCEYCERAYLALEDLKADYRANQKIEVIGYCFDEKVTPDVQQKLNAMVNMVHYRLNKKDITMPAELSRLPLMIVENGLNHKFDVYSGFSNERFHYLKKSVLRSISPTALSGDDNEQQ